MVPLFDGELLVISTENIGHECNTRINLQNGIYFGCPLPPSSQTFLAQINETVSVHAEYLQPYTSGTFYHCVGIQQNGNY